MPDTVAQPPGHRPGGGDGHRSTGADLVEDFGPVVYSLAMAITGSHQLAEETTEAAFRHVRATASDPTLPVGLRIIGFAHHDAVRRVREIRDGDETAAASDQPDGGLLGAAVRSRLTDEEAAALLLTYLRGYTLRQAADILDQSPPTLMGHLRSALAKATRRPRA